MSDIIADQISILCSQIHNRRFGDGTLRILESILVSKDVNSLLEVRSSLREFMRSEIFSVIHGIEEKTVEQKLSVLEFFVRAFALAGDVESCLALRYEGLVLRELKSASHKWLQVSYREWLTFAEHSLDGGYYSIAGKACENALSRFEMKDVAGPESNELKENAQTIERIKKLKDVAVGSAASRSVQAQASEYIKKKTIKKKTIKRSKDQSPLHKGTQCLASTLFRNGIKNQNVRKLHELQKQKPWVSRESGSTPF